MRGEGLKPTYDLQWGETASLHRTDPDADTVTDTCWVSAENGSVDRYARCSSGPGSRTRPSRCGSRAGTAAAPDPGTVHYAAGRDDFDPPDPGVINFDKGLPLEKALHEDTILAWAHNGEHLLHVHGAPVRLVVPGWAGNLWVKWIQKIEVMDHIPDCYHQSVNFVFGKSPDDPDKKMMTSLGVKTLVLEPRDEHSPLSSGTHAVRGLAWSGEGETTRVEISVDGGRTWCDAEIEYSPDKWLWKRWFYWPVRASVASVGSQSARSEARRISTPRRTGSASPRRICEKPARASPRRSATSREPGCACPSRAACEKSMWTSAST